MSVEAGHLEESTLNLLVDQALDEEASIRAQVHLAACPMCTRRLTDLKAVCATIEALPDLPLRRDLSGEVVASIRLRGRARAWPLAAVAGSQALLAVALLTAVWGRVTGQVESVGQAAFRSWVLFCTFGVGLPVATLWAHARAGSMGILQSVPGVMNRLSLGVSGVTMPQALAMAIGGAAFAILGNALLLRGRRTMEAEA